MIYHELLLFFVIDKHKHINIKEKKKSNKNALHPLTRAKSDSISRPPTPLLTKVLTNKK